MTIIAHTALLGKFGFVLDIIQLVMGSTIAMIGIALFAAIVLISWLVTRGKGAPETSTASGDNSSEAGATGGGISLDK